MPTMVERIATRLLKESLEHGYWIERRYSAAKLYRSFEDTPDELVLESSFEECNDRMRELISDIYALAILDEMRTPDAAMLWVKSKGYEAMIEAALKT